MIRDGPIWECDVEEAEDQLWWASQGPYFWRVHEAILCAFDEGDEDKAWWLAYEGFPSARAYFYKTPPWEVRQMGKLQLGVATDGKLGIGFNNKVSNKNKKEVKQHLKSIYATYLEQYTSTCTYHSAAAEYNSENKSEQHTMPDISTSSDAAGSALPGIERVSYENGRAIYHLSNPLLDVDGNEFVGPQAAAEPQADAMHTKDDKDDIVDDTFDPNGIDPNDTVDPVTNNDRFYTKGGFWYLRRTGVTHCLGPIDADNKQKYHNFCLDLVGPPTPKTDDPDEQMLEAGDAASSVDAQAGPCDEDIIARMVSGADGGAKGGGANTNESEDQVMPHPDSPIATLSRSPSDSYSDDNQLQDLGPITWKPHVNYMCLFGVPRLFWLSLNSIIVCNSSSLIFAISSSVSVFSYRGPSWQRNVSCEFYLVTFLADATHELSNALV